MAALLFNPPQSFNLPLSKGRDLYFELLRRVLVTGEDGLPVLDEAGQKQYAVTDYPEGTVLVLEIDTTVPTVVDAVIDGPRATFLADYLVADVIPSGKPYRAKMTVGDIDNVLVHGKTVRKDT